MSPADNQDLPQQQQQSQHDLTAQYRAIGIKALSAAAAMVKTKAKPARPLVADQFQDRDDG
ncbi:hypothetical protein [Methylobrevis pamukkalensis]|uniref:Uncharacterized protein n=1 Tax=Methylobrevis pamukkalensis TaxID=1439726 RepID=A0A1E3H0E4_9HYPH|nr:hypothetical protein [Methylobrevis pamukkalensis]ODN69762.1 hypothetical protein A6302_02929 [Methylobrevis pamukkalensis]